MSNLIEEVKKIVKENQEKLDACPLPHEFSIPLDRITKQEIPEPKLFCRWRCKKCGANVDFEHKHWYNLGLKHRNS